MVVLRFGFGKLRKHLVSIWGDLFIYLFVFDNIQ